MPEYRYYNCDPPRGREFGVEPGAVVACPGCHLKLADPLGKGRILKLEVIHFDAPHPVAAQGTGVGTGYAACDPKKTMYLTGPGPVAPGSQVQYAGTLFTGEPLAVTCKKCRETKAWQDAPKNPEPGTAPEE